MFGVLTTAIVRFVSLASDRYGAITSYRWEFGDGKTASGRRVRHTYARAGVYMVKLTVVEDSDGVDDTQDPRLRAAARIGGRNSRCRSFGLPSCAGA